MINCPGSHENITGKPKTGISPRILYSDLFIYNNNNTHLALNTYACKYKWNHIQYLWLLCINIISLKETYRTGVLSRNRREYDEETKESTKALPRGRISLNSNTRALDWVITHCIVTPLRKLHLRQFPLSSRKSMCLLFSFSFLFFFFKERDTHSRKTSQRKLQKTKIWLSLNGYSQYRVHAKFLLKEILEWIYKKKLKRARYHVFS